MTNGASTPISLINTSRRENREITYSVNEAQLADERPKVRGWYRWELYVEAPQEVLQKIKWVDYDLHPSFTPRTYRSRDREKKFRISSIGWGEFEIGVSIAFMNGETLSTKHYLDLVDGRKTEISVDGRFLS
jgi:transcription initiation factor IIF auxiliary subunit